ncbi:2-oxoglutarate dehydrogenase E1 component [Ceratobasidium sp. UAMH 11750]|nr:2-oxoglutarate dehydrogenase E1 component [Ceratobasidium sp. UAMH 11750]
MRSLLRQRAIARAARPLPRLRAYATAQPPSPHDAFATGTNAYYAEEMYRHWREDPSSVHTSWQVYFAGLDKGLPSSSAFQPPPDYTGVPVAAGGAPTLNIGGGSALTDHLKASRC